MLKFYGRAGICLLLIAVFSTASRAAPIVNSPQTITQEVFVQPIITGNGTNNATYFGDAAQQAQIEQYIDMIWAQAGINITFLAPTFYTNAFAYNNNGNTAGTRPTADLSTIVSGAGSPPKSATSTTINMFLVDFCPGFTMLSENTAAGLAFVGGNGITQFIGDNLLTFEAGRTVIAGVVAHEIGHNLGLNHTADGGDNLMSPSGTSDRLTDAGGLNQITIALNSNLSVPVTPVPEPSTVFAFGVMVMGLGYTVRRRMAA